MKSYVPIATMHIRLSNLLGAMALLAIGFFFLSQALPLIPRDPTAQPAAPFVLHLVGCAAFIAAAIGMIADGAHGAAIGFVLSLALGTLALIFLKFLDLRFLG